MGLAVLSVFILCSLYIHYRGKVRHTFARQLTDHSTLMAPINCLFYTFSEVDNSPYIDINKLPELNEITDNWETIREEAINLDNAAAITDSDKLDDLGFNSLFKSGWKRFYLKWYGTRVKSAEKLCPKTVELLNSIKSVKAAMFTMLPPGARLVRHRDPYAGSLRYHLGLITPNSDDCCIYVDGDKYGWRDGEAVIFDETFIHYAENNTDENRIILFLDVKRPVKFFLIDWLDTFLSKTLLAATATKNTEGDKVGFLNKLFFYVYQIRIVGKKLKKFNRKLYYTIKYIIFALLIYLIFF